MNMVTNVRQGYLRENAIGKEIDNTESGENNPIGKPFSVIRFVGRFNGRHWPIGRQHEPNDVADERREVSEDHVKSHNCQDTWKDSGYEATDVKQRFSEKLQLA